MCGICGLLDFERPPDARRLRAMMDALRHRGPDAAAAYTLGPVALGHCRLAVLDPEHSHQPMRRQAPSGRAAVLSYSGEVYNFRQLRHQLQQRGHHFTTTGDTEVVLAAYLEWELDFPRHLDGMFALALWDESDRTLVLVRDRLGIKPLYYARVGSQLAFASEPKGVFAGTQLTPRVTGDGLCELLSMARTPGSAVYHGMREVLPGCVMIVTADQVQTRRYWQLSPPEHTGGFDDSVDELDELLSQTMQRQVISDVPIGTLLSGGLDSSLLTALAAGNEPDTPPASQAAGLRAFCVSFDGQELADELRAGSDHASAHEVATRVGAHLETLSVETPNLLDADLWQRTLRARDLPALGDMDTSLVLLFAAIRERVTVAISGEGADEVFGGYAWMHDPDCVSADTFPWLAMTRRLGRDAVFEPRLVRQLDLRGYQAEQYRAALAEAPGGDEPVGEGRMRALTYLHLTRFLPIPLDRKDRLSMAYGLEVRVPYLDHRVVEYAFGVPWRIHATLGQHKALLRGVAARHLPDSIAQRSKNPFPTTADTRYHAELQRRVQQLIQDRQAPILEVLNRAGIRALVALPASGSQLVRLGLERVLRLNEWLVDYDVDIAIEGRG